MATDAELIYGDPGYEGDTYDPESITRFADADYYRAKIAEFQQTLNNVDAAYRQLAQIYQIPGLSEDIWYEALLAIEDYNARRSQFVITAEAINAASAAANMAGFRMPVVSIPQTLGLAPLALAGVGAAVAGAAALIVWGVEWIRGANAIAMRISMLETLSPGDRALAVNAALETERILAQTEAGPLANIAGIVKWAGIGLAAFFLYRAFERYKSR